MSKIGEKRVGRRGEQKRRWDRGNRRPCSTVGCENTVWATARGTQCRDCERAARRERRNVRWLEIQRRWLLGESEREIAVALGTSKSAIGRTVNAMRSDGWDVPYRHNYPKSVV